jgi:ribonuclease R
MHEKDQYRLSKLLLPKMTKAVYKEKPLWHFWLALDFYSHFTSPIRRYPDLLLHRIIRHFLHSGKWLYSEKDVKVKSDKSSLRERNAEMISRALEERVKSLYMKPFIGEIYDGIISGITERNIYIELSNGVEWSIFIPKGNLIFHSLSGSLRSTSGHILYTIWDTIRVRIESINTEFHRIELSEAPKQIMRA